jgi:hypothetical protein
MKKLNVFLILSVSLLGWCSSCNSGRIEGEDQGLQKVYLNELIAIDQIDSVRMSNNSGGHMVDPAKLNSFKRNLNQAHTCDMSCKHGAIGFSIFINGQETFFLSRTHGEYIEAHGQEFYDNDSINGTLTFKTYDFNLDNY